MPSRFPPLAPQPPAKPQHRALTPVPWAEFGLFTLFGLLLLA